LATGSVVDALSEDDLAGSIVPYSDADEALRIGNQAVDAWELFRTAGTSEAQAGEIIRRAIEG